MKDRNAAAAAPRSPVSAALAEMNAPAPLVVPGNVLLWRILVEPLEPPKKVGSFEMPEEVTRAEEILTSIGRVVQMGHFAFKSKTNAGLLLDDEPHKPKVGDYVLHEQYAGHEIKLRDGRKLRVIQDTEILMVMSEDEARQIKAYL